MVRQWFNSGYFKKIRKYKNLDLGRVAEEEFSYFLENIFYYIEIIEDIIEKENPDKIIIPGELELFNKTIIGVAKAKKIKVEKILKMERLRNFVNDLINKIHFKSKFHKFPKINRREFIKTKRRIKDAKKSNILLLGLDDTYFNRLGDVPYELKKEKKNFFSLCTDLNTQNTLKEKGIKFFSFGDFIDSHIKNKVEKRKKQFNKYWKVLKRDFRFKNIFNYKNINLFDIIEKEIKYLIKIKFPWIMYYIETAEKCINSQKVDMVVSIDDLIPITRSIIMLAKSKKIPSLIIQNGIMGEASGEGFIPLIADKLAVWGKKDKEFMIEKRINPKRIIITGNPQLKKIGKFKVNENFYKKFNLSKKKKTIVVATQAFNDLLYEKEFSELVEILIKYLKNEKDKQLIIKLHPRERKEIYENILKGTNAKNVYIIKENLEEVINMCDVLITINSTIILDALMINKPIIIANFFPRPCRIPYTEYGATIKADNEIELRKVLKKLPKINKKAREKFLCDYIYKRDGKAGKRIIKLIDEMINETIIPR